MDKQEIQIGRFFQITFEHMIAIGFRYTNYDNVRPGAYRYTIMFLFIEITWGII